ncbi:peptide chain release factor 2 [Blochmannia endosymbiont of Polyrhachis (Hedomyrma) turneri]|nr:peptide chain release factor 2 [Blochmannia endosymbiont of Polyrhachis (Hedomyrma) turneri]
MKEGIYKLKSPDMWNQHKKVKILSKEVVCLDKDLKAIDNIVQDLQELNDFLDLFECELIDQTDVQVFKEDLDNIEHKIAQLELQQMLSDKYDVNCYIDIQSGSGGVDAQDWVSILLRMYLRWIEFKGLNGKIISESLGDVAGLKSVTCNISGRYAYAWLRTETGIHRLVRKSPFNSAGRRHTSFASVFVYPECVENINVQINTSELRFDVYRASGAGGQHVNRTESAVRVTHLPTNIVTQCQNDRSQHKNKEQAIKQLKAKLYNLELQKKRTEKDIIEKSKLDITWGNQIRSYILDDSRVKDLRTGYETHNVRSILDGNLDQFIEASLKAGL